MTFPRFCIDKKMSEFRDHRPENIRPKMSTTDRAKQFAPFAALGRMDAILRQVERTRQTDAVEHVSDYTDFENLFRDQLNGKTDETFEFDIDMLSAEHIDSRFDEE